MSNLPIIPYDIKQYFANIGCDFLYCNYEEGENIIIFRYKYLPFYFNNIVKNRHDVLKEIINNFNDVYRTDRLYRVEHYDFVLCLSFFIEDICMLDNESGMYFVFMKLILNFERINFVNKPMVSVFYDAQMYTIILHQKTFVINNLNEYDVTFYTDKI